MHSSWDLFHASVTRPVSILLLAAWVAVDGAARQSVLSPGIAVNLATDLARYGSAAVWRGVYYRGEKIGFTVSQTVPTDDGFELQEDGRLQMSLLGATTPARSAPPRASTSISRCGRSSSRSIRAPGPVEVRGRRRAARS